MTILLFIFYPLSVILNIIYNIGYIGFIIIFVFNALKSRECDYEYLPLSRMGVVFSFIKQVIMDIICFILGTILLAVVFILGNGLYIIFEVIGLIILLVGQSILWPIVEFLRYYRTNNKIIKGCWRGVKREHELFNNTNNNNISNDINENKNNTQNITEINNKSNNNDDNTNNNYQKSNSLFSIQEIVYNEDNKLIIPSNYFKCKSFIHLALQIWIFRMKKAIFSCILWDTISLYPIGIILMMFPSLRIKYITKQYEGLRFFWKHEKTIIEQPKFY